MKLVDLLNEDDSVSMPNEIENHITKITEYIAKLEKYNKQNYSIIVSLSILDCIGDFAKMAQHLESMEKVGFDVSNKTHFYSKIVQSYYGEDDLPEDVDRLDKLVDRLNYLGSFVYGILF